MQLMGTVDSYPHDHKQRELERSVSGSPRYYKQYFCLRTAPNPECVLEASAALLVDGGPKLLAGK